MRLKRLKLSGFKSFCDDTVLDFQNNGITMVVGPNGCGKSNVVDAIRWVLGEQAPRFLRGQAMSDVIFNGSDARKPVGRSEVTILFDNKNGGAPEKYRDYEEIAVTRRLYRSGESEYLINKAPCRLMDVRELVMDTGAAGRSYSIVEQGRVEEFITATPAERRIYMEEAAGIVRYKTKRIAAERKLEQTRQNLLRVEDLQGELNRQESQLREQKVRAQTYITLRDEVQGLTVRLARSKFLASAALCRDLGLKAEELRGGNVPQEQALATLQTRLEQLNVEQAQRETRLKERREAVHGHEGEIHEKKTRQAVEEQNRQNCEEWIGQTEATVAEIGARQSDLAGELSTAQESLLALQGQEQSEGAGIAELETEQAREEAARAALDAENAGRREEAVQCHTRLSGIASQQQYLRERLAEGEQRRTGLDTQLLAAGQEHEGAAGRLQAARDASAELRQAMEEREERALVLGREITAKAAEFGENQARQQRAEREALECRSRIASLREIEAGREGFDQSVRAVVEWAEQADGVREALGWLGPLADFIKVREEALPWAGDYLAPALEWIVVREEARLPLVQQTLEAQGLGGVRVVALDAFAAAPAAAPNTLAELVELPAEFAGLRNALFGTVKLHPGGALPHPLPRPNGVPAEWLAEDGGFHVDHRTVVTLGKTGAPAAGILHRRAEIATLEERLGGLETRQSEIQAEVGRLETEAGALQAKLQEEESLRTEQTLAMSRLEQEQEHAEREAARLAQVLEGLRASRTELAAEAERFETQQRELEEEARRTEERRQELEDELATGLERARAAAEALQAQQARLTERKVAHGQIASRVEHAANRVAALEAEQSELARKLATARENLAVQQGRLATAERTIAELKEALVERERALADEVRELLESTGRFDEEEAERKKLAGQAAEERRRLEQGQARLHEVELTLTAETTRMEQWAERMGEAAPDAPETPPEDEQALEKTLAEAQRKLEKMEGVNLAAPEEYDAVATRLDFLLNQKEDLEAAIRDLEESIRRMNQESRRRFKETFDQVNAKFQEVFPLIFNGGTAKLVLTDSEDLLLAGVDIVAQPPGKQLQSLNLLSGGEKALTAIALIFSFFLFKPSPFCLLDEVDAPLDDVNVGRFARMIQSMTERSQFIIITHNKRTMEIGDTLYGVTMEEAGVSKIVSVNLAQ